MLHTKAVGLMVSEKILLKVFPIIVCERFMLPSTMETRIQIQSAQRPYTAFPVSDDVLYVI